MAAMSPGQSTRAKRSIEKIHARGAIRRFLPPDPGLELNPLLPESLTACWRAVTLGEDRDAPGVVRNREALDAELLAVGQRPFVPSGSSADMVAGGLRVMRFVDGGALVLALTGEHAGTIWRFQGAPKPNRAAIEPAPFMIKGKPAGYGAWFDGVLKQTLADVLPILDPASKAAQIVSPIQELPGDYLEAGALESLALSATQLFRLPPEIGRLTQLRKLIVGAAALSELPQELAQLVELRWLGVGPSQLAELPDWICQLSKLEVLELHTSPTERLPDALGELTQLSKLSLSNLELAELPAGIARCAALAELTLKNCPLKSIPPGLMELPALGLLTLERLQLHELPSLAGTAIRELTLSELPLAEGQAWSALTGAINLRTLVLRQLKLGSQAIPTLPQLETLRIYGCELSELPRGIQDYSGLKTLCLDRNPLRHLPGWVFELPLLKELYLFDTPFSEDDVNALRSAYPAVQIHWFAPRR